MRATTSNLGWARIGTAQLIERVKRRLVREPTYIKVTIHPLVMDAPVECMIRNISEIGANLRVANAAVPVSSLFDLEIPSRGERRRCHLVWRNKDVIGVEFAEYW